MHACTHTHMRMHIVIPLILHPPDRGQIIKQYPYSMKILQVISFVTDPVLGLRTDHSSIPFGLSPSAAGSGASWHPSMFAKSFQFLPGMVKHQDLWISSLHRQRSCCSTDKGSGDTTLVNAHTLEGVLWGVSDLGLFSSTTELSGFPKYQVTD